MEGLLFINNFDEREMACMKRIQVLFVLMLGVCVWMGGGSGVLQAAPAENPYAVAGIDNAAEFEKAFAVFAGSCCRQ